MRFDGMLNSLFTRAFEKRKPPAAAAAPANTRIYAIGDVHGREDLLGELAERIKEDLKTAPPYVVTIFLGDYIDRGPRSAEVVDRLANRRFPTQIRTLRGNHEEMLRQFLSDASILDEWRRYGGLETLHSYGIDVSQVSRGEGFELARTTLLRALPAEHSKFLEATELSVTLGDYFFCHAGVRPGAALEDQNSRDLLWIRDGFLRFERPFGKIIVHGHTPVASPEIKSNRINIDTGAFATSILTCLILEGAERRFLSTGQRGKTL
jgi:serine/threonine protein phosphatase 1